MKKTKEVAIKSETSVIEQEVIDKALADLDAMYPKEQSGFIRIQLPRIAYVAQDVMEGKGKEKKVVISAGTFILETQTDELDENEKKIWKKEEIGSEMEGIILYHRYQLSYYDQATELFTSSPVYDDKDEIIPLWCDKKQIAKDTPANLKKLYNFTDPKDNKVKSNLKDNRILYILYKGQLHQLSLHGSSMYSFIGYTKKVMPSKVLTTFNSESKENGSIEWNMLTFKVKCPLVGHEILNVLEKTKEIVIAISMEKGGREKVETPKQYIEIDEDEDLKNF